MFRTRLRQLREDNGYKSQQAFADAFGVAQSTVGNWEAGKREPKFETTIRLAKFLHTNVDYLLGFTEQEEKSTPEDKGGPVDPLCSTLLHNFDQLNQEGRERLVETSDDMVRSGKYIKSDSARLGKEA